ncbi:MAG: response regulator, partial [Deltaproteobacteria bacterium]
MLLVEDAPDSREAMQEVLEQFGAQVVPATNGRDALEKLNGAAPDLVVCDLRMPVMDGYEFVRRLRADPLRADLPVVAVSGFGEESRNASRDAGFDAYLAKPVDASTLVTL